MLRYFLVFIVLFSLLSFVWGLDMDATFKKFLAAGIEPHRCVKIDFHKAGDIYFPASEHVITPSCFNKIIFYDEANEVYYDVTESLRLDDGYYLEHDWALETDARIYFGSSERFSGIKFEIDGANTDNSQMLGFYIGDDDNLHSILNISDGTKVGTKTMAQSGTVSWDSSLMSFGWSKTEVCGHEYYWVDLRVDASLNRSTQIDKCSIKNRVFKFIVQNNCIQTVGKIHSKFNIEPENYGMVVGNLNVTFNVNSITKQLLCNENWRGCDLSYIEYFPPPGAEEYDFTNSDNIMRTIPFVITQHPMSGDETFNVTAESIQSRYNRMQLPTWNMTRGDFPRIPGENEERPAPIIISSGVIAETADKEIFCVDEGASAVVKTAVGGTEDDKVIECEDLSNWDAFIGKQNPVASLGKEKVFVESINFELNTMTVIRKWGDTEISTIDEGTIIVEYNPREEYVIGRHTMATGQLESGGNARIKMVNPDDDRETWLVPHDWYDVYENDTTKCSDGITTVKTKRPLRGYFASTTDYNKLVKTCQEGAYPTQFVEELPTIVTLNGMEAYGFPTNCNQITLIKTFPADTSILLAEGWTNTEAIFSDSGDTATFQGLAPWNLQGKKYATLSLSLNSFYNQSGSFTLDALQSGAFSYFLAVRLYLENVYEPGSEVMYFRTNIDTDTNQPPNATWLYYYFPTQMRTSHIFGRSNVQSLFYGITDTFNWSDLLLPIDVYISNQSDPMTSGSSPNNWANVITHPKRITYEMEFFRNSLIQPTDFNAPNFTDGSEITYEEANGMWTSEFHDQPYWSSYEIRGSYWDNPPSAAYTVSECKLRFVYDLDTSDLDSLEEFYLEWDPFGYHGGPYYYDLINGSYSSPLEIDVPFNAEYWAYQHLRIHVKLFYHDTAPIKIYNADIIIKYTEAENDALWTDDEDHPWWGYLCGAIQNEGDKSFCWLMRQTSGGNYANKDGVLKCPLHRRGLDYGLINKVYIKARTFINPFDEDTTTGGCMHQVGSEYFPAAWIWYSHFNHRAGAWTGTAGYTTIGTLTFYDDDATFITWGVRGVQDVDADTLPDIIHYREDGNGSDPPTNEGTYVIEQVVSETELLVSIDHTNRWDIEKVSWTAFEETASSVKYRIHRPYALDQAGSEIIQYFDITDQYDWDADLDFGGYIYLRGHLWSEKTQSDYSNPANPSVFLAWQPQLEMEYNYGKKAISVVTGMQGINSGDNDPISVWEWTAQNEALIDTDLFDDTSFDNAIAHNQDSDGNTIRKIDYHMKTRESFKVHTRNMTQPFNWHVFWDELISAKNGATRKVLAGTVLTQSEDIKAYGARTQWEDHDFSQHAHSASYGGESDSTTGWSSSTGCTIASNSSALTGGVGSYSIKVTASATDSIVDLTYDDVIHMIEDHRLTLLLEASTAMTIQVSVLLGNYYDSGVAMIQDSFAVSTTTVKRRINIPKNVTKKITGVRIRATCNINDIYYIDDVHLQKELSTIETPSRQILISNPIQILSLGSVGKMDIPFTNVNLSYRHLPWTSTRTVCVNGSEAAKRVSSQGSARYAALQALYGDIPFPENLSKLIMVGDKFTTERYFTDLDKWLSERIIILGMSLDPAGKQLEIGNIVFMGLAHNFPLHYGQEKHVLKYFQILSIDGEANIDAIEVNDNFTNCLI